MKSKTQLESKMEIRQPIVTVAGHVDHGKTSILDCFRDSKIQESEAGGITQRISFTKFPMSHIKTSCPLIDKQGIKVSMPGFLFIDTPGHAAFTNLRKRGGSLADLAIVVVSIKEGIKPQTAEVLQILKAHKTPFLIALNKVDQISGWNTQIDKPLNESIASQGMSAHQEFEQAVMTFQGALQEHGFEADLYYDVSDFSKKVAIVPCSAKTREGIPELLFVLCGLCQKYLTKRLELLDIGKGVVLEVKKEKGMDGVESILYDGMIKVGDEIAIASLNGGAIVSKVRGIEEIEPLCDGNYCNVEEARAATGVRRNFIRNALPKIGRKFG
jgi:translation initiation factor 5B